MLELQKCIYLACAASPSYQYGGNILSLWTFVEDRRIQTLLDCTCLGFSIAYLHSSLMYLILMRHIRSHTPKPCVICMTSVSWNPKSWWLDETKGQYCDICGCRYSSGDHPSSLYVLQSKPIYNVYPTLSQMVRTKPCLDPPTVMLFTQHLGLAVELYLHW